tara:strand:+ start:1498 stop:1680 length:183 start_codon:yes stop_codon:yes gene_type:complete
MYTQVYKTNKIMKKDQVSDGSVSIRIPRETIEKLLDWVENEQRRLKGLPKRKKTVLKFDI